MRCSLLLALTLAWAGLARAQSCCTATGSSEFGSVPNGRFAAVATELSWDRAWGTLDSSGDYRRLEDAQVDDITWRWGGGIRIVRPWLQLYGSLPLKLQYRNFSGLAAATRVGVGDGQLGLRATLFEDRIERLDASRLVTLLPFVEPFIGARAPSGRAAEDSKTQSQVDVMGDGAWLVFGGLSLTKYLNDTNALSLAGTLGHRFPRSVATAGGRSRRFEPGNEYDARLSWLKNIGLFWSFSLFTNLRLTSAAKTDGVAQVDGSTRRIRAGASLRHYLSFPSWQLSGTLASDLPFDGLGKNVPFAGTSLTLTLQRNLDP